MTDVPGRDHEEGEYTAQSTSDKILRLPAVKAATGLGRSAIYDGMDKGTFPKQRKIGARAVGWYASAVQQWIDARPPTRE
jgi:prophage regulatory protein